MERLAEVAAKELLTYPVPGKKEKLKRVIKKLLGRQNAPQNPYGWPNGLLALGLFRYVQSLNAQQETGSVEEAVSALDRYFAGWRQKGYPVRSLEDTLAGYALLLWSKRTGREDFRIGAQKIADWLKAYPTDALGAWPYRADQENGHVYVDALGMAAPFAVRYGLETGDREMLDLGCKQLELFLQYGMEEQTYLPYHGYRADGQRYGIVGWGRAVGWLLLGLSESLGAVEEAVSQEPTGEALPEQAFLWIQESKKSLSGLRDGFYRLAEAAASYQRQDGTLSWHLPETDGPADSSALSMYAYSAAKGIQTGLLPEKKFRRSLELAEQALKNCEQNGRIGQASGECGGFGIYPQVYGHYPWGQGPTLGFLALWGSLQMERTGKEL